LPQALQNVYTWAKKLATKGGAEIPDDIARNITQEVYLILQRQPIWERIGEAGLKAGLNNELRQAQDKALKKAREVWGRLALFVKDKRIPNLSDLLRKVEEKAIKAADDVHDVAEAATPRVREKPQASRLKEGETLEEYVSRVTGNELKDLPPENVVDMEFPTPEAAERKAQELIKEGHLVEVKGKRVRAVEKDVTPEVKAAREAAEAAIESDEQLAKLIDDQMEWVEEASEEIRVSALLPVLPFPLSDGLKIPSAWKDWRWGAVLGLFPFPGADAEVERRIKQLKQEGAGFAVAAPALAAAPRNRWPSAALPRESMNVWRA